MANKNIIVVHCAKCQQRLYRYNKEYGEKLVKCYIDMIRERIVNRGIQKKTR